MRSAAYRLMLPLAVWVAASGCVAHHHAYDSDRGYDTSHSTVIEYRYHSGHPLPDYDGGGWCPHDYQHVHPYEPSYSQHFVYHSGGYHYRGPVVVWYVGSHLDRHGGSCASHGRHWHDYAPRGHGHHYDRGREGYVWSPNRPHDASPVASRPGYATPPPGQGAARPPSGHGSGRDVPPGWGQSPGHGKGRGNGYGHANHGEDHPGKGRAHHKYDDADPRVSDAWSVGAPHGHANGNGDGDGNGYSNNYSNNSNSGRRWEGRPGSAERKNERSEPRSIWGSSNPSHTNSQRPLSRPSEPTYSAPRPSQPRFSSPPASQSRSVGGKVSRQPSQSSGSSASANPGKPASRARTAAPAPSRPSLGRPISRPASPGKLRSR